jgi:hypothetical protein
MDILIAFIAGMAEVIVIMALINNINERGSK